MKCLNCPCADICLGWPAFCMWAAEDPPDDIKLRHICVRSATAAPIVSSLASAHDSGRPAVSEAIALVKAMKACPFRSTDPGCGCAGGRCALRRGSVVSHPDCFDCLQRYASHHQA